MTLYLFLYFLVVVALFYMSVWSYFQSKRQIVDVFFSVGFLSLGIWLFLYFLFFIGVQNPDILTYLTRGMYFFGSLTGSTFLMYIIFYKKPLIELTKKFVFIYSSIVVFFGILTLFTPHVISHVELNEVSGVYNEAFGKLFFIYQLLYLAFIPFLIKYTYKKYHILNKIDKKRFQWFLFGFLLMIVSWYLFLVIFPMFDIWILEKQQILYIIPLLITIFYSSYRYNFIDVELLIGRIFNILLGIILTLGILHLIELYISDFLDKRLTQFWELGDNSLHFDGLLAIVLFCGFYSLGEKYIFKNDKYVLLSKKIGKIRKNLVHFYDIAGVNKYLSSEFGKIFQTNFVQITLFNEQNKQNLKTYFEKYNYQVFVNDIVFLEENKYKFDVNEIVQEINPKAFLIFPLVNNNKEFLGIFEMSTKLLSDVYTKEEEDILKDFCDFLVSHLKYMETYEKIQELNLSLDKKVDQKTMMYNNLLNKQTDFIAMASHEIKNPLGVAIFQLDGILDDLKYNETNLEKIETDLEDLNNQLIKVGNLTKNIFSAQKYDLEKVELYKQKIDIVDFLSNKVEVYRKIYPEINYIFTSNRDECYYDFDKIQLEQVVDNLLNNAEKFVSKSDPKISIDIQVSHTEILISIADNGIGFRDGEEKIIFEKYSSGNIASTGLGMGLYLCKKIVEYHQGNILAKNHPELGGALFEIYLPK